jgi:hypothetical protein
MEMNLISPVTQKFICFLFYFDIIGSDCFMQIIWELAVGGGGEGRKERFSGNNGIYILPQFPSLCRTSPLAFTCLGNLLALRVKYVAWLHGWPALDYFDSLPTVVSYFLFPFL